VTAPVNVLITGASGFSGRALAARLSLEPNLRLFALSRTAPESAAPFREIHLVDLSDFSKTLQILESVRPHWIFHLAGKLKGSEQELFQANTQNSINLLKAAAHAVPNARMLFVGSAAEYGPGPFRSPISENQTPSPSGAYGESKRQMTLAARGYARITRLQIKVARTFNLLGPGIPSTLLLGALIERIRSAVAEGKDIIRVGEVSAERDFIDVRDAANAYLALMESDASGEVFNVCSGIGTRIQELVEAALKLSPKPMRYETDPLIAAAGAPSVIGNPEKIRKLGFTPRISIAQSIADSCAPFASQ
jgi:GDP-4-dehydro-6-deoxy-D-mannose reductase